MVIIIIKEVITIMAILIISIINLIIWKTLKKTNKIGILLIMELATLKKITSLQQIPVINIIT
jgi:hypothetical protein